ncbi:MAG: hypothetical protein JWQ34_1566 [Mucilaginibacter sp.]|nr:hypothetical protein [Mucilaginibacter sp.]
MPLNASASKTLTISLPLPLTGSAMARGMCRVISHINIIAPNKLAANCRLILRMIPAAPAISATPAKYPQNVCQGSHAGTSIATNGIYKKCIIPATKISIAKKHLPYGISLAKTAINPF